MILKQDLLLKIPADKPPFIGILYDSAAESIVGAQMPDLIGKDNLKFELFLEVFDGYVKLRLQVVGFSTIHWFGKVNYNSQELRMWINQVKDSKQINFGQALRDLDGVITVARTIVERKAICMPLARLYLFNGQDKKIIKIAN